MIRPYLPLTSLRAFEAAARHLSFTNAAVELRVTPAALSHQVKSLEERLGIILFHRLPRGLSLTDEGAGMLPVLRECFDRMAVLLEQVDEKSPRDIVTVGVVGTFAVSWLLPRLDAFERDNGSVDLRLSTHNNRVDLAEEGLDFAIRFGDGAWNATQADLLFEAPFTPLCAPAVAARLKAPSDLLGERLLRSYRVADWQAWLEAAEIPTTVIRGIMFDSAGLMVDAAMKGQGVALAPRRMFEPELTSGRLVAPFDLDVGLGAYWLTRLKSREVTRGMQLLRSWLLSQTAGAAPAGRHADTSH
jgi:LysR family transcriptional regulator of beta-lactamase